jgi:hypothetical protein
MHFEAYKQTSVHLLISPAGLAMARHRLSLLALLDTLTPYGSCYSRRIGVKKASCALWMVLISNHS